jgi:hypothetical protein
VSKILSRGGLLSGCSGCAHFEEEHCLWQYEKRYKKENHSDKLSVQDQT